MPNVKIYIDETCYDALRPAVSGLLPELRAMLCDGLEVAPAACQLSLIHI